MSASKSAERAAGLGKLDSLYYIPASLHHLLRLQSDLVMAQYGKASYWDERYNKDPEPFDWYQRYSGIRDFVNQYIKREDQILMAGCGTSRLTENMFEDGYTSITNIDISRVVIDIMTERYRDKPTMQFMQMNCCALDFPDETFDAVIAKGTVDSILCGEGSTANMTKLCSEVSRVLKPRGVFFIVSYGVPDNRLNYLEKEDIYSWTVTVHTVPKPSVSASAIPAADESSSVHYIYVCTKGGGAAEN